MINSRHSRHHKTNIPNQPITPAEHLFVWAGGAMFVAALAYCAYSYLVVWARAAAFDARAIVVDSVLFGFFAAHHSLFARERVKDVVARAVPDRLIRSVYVWIASALLIVGCAAWRPVGGELYRATGWRAIAHAGVQIAGLLIIARSARAIDSLELAGIRHRSAGGPLQIAGPYGWVRHPLYLGWLLATCGAAHMTGDRLTFAAISGVYLIAAIPWEERSLLRSFGKHYEEYRRQVRWRVVPYVY